MPSIQLSGEDVSTKERLAWERDMMGVYLSEHPFTAYLKDLDTQNITLIGQITDELEGQVINLVGSVSSVRELYTKDHRAFCSAILEDLEASIEVMVWNRIYEETKDLWQEGSVLQVQGKVRAKEDRIQITCEAVAAFGPGSEAMQLASRVPAGRPSGKNGNGNGGGKNGNGSNGNTKKKPAAVSEQRRLIITIRETQDEAKDEELFNALMGILKDYKGKDEVCLKVVNTERVTNMKLANTFVDITPDLEKKLAVLINPEDYIVDTL